MEMVMADEKMNDKIYDKLVKRFPLRPIRDDEQNMQAAEVCDSLTDRLNTLSQSESDYLEVLSDLIVKYELRFDEELTEMTPRQLIQYFIDQDGLAQKDLVPEFGSASRVSEFLKGDRRLSMEQAKRLSDRFRVNISALIDSY